MAQLDMATNHPMSPNSPLGQPIEDSKPRDAPSRTTPKRARDASVARSLPRVDLGQDTSVKERIEAMEAKMVALQEELKEHQTLLNKAYEDIEYMKNSKRPGREGKDGGGKNFIDEGDHELEEVDKKDAERPLKYDMEKENWRLWHAKFTAVLSSAGTVGGRSCSTKYATSPTSPWTRSPS